MKSQTYTISTVDLNTGNENSVDTIINYVLKGATGNRNLKMYPTALQIINDTGTDIEMTFLNENEISEYPNSDYYGFFLVKNNTVLRLSDFSPLPFPSRVIVKKVVAGTATKDLRIDAINFSSI